MFFNRVSGVFGSGVINTRVQYGYVFRDLE